MSEIVTRVQEFIKEKPAVAGAIGVAAVGGVYLLTRSGGGGLGAIAGQSNPAQPATPAAQPGQSGQGGGGGGSSSNDLAAIADQLAQAQSQQSGFQAKIQDALAAVVNQFNSALGQQQQQNQAGLSALAAQTNQALSGLGQGQQVPDFNGFASQLVSNLNQQLSQLRAAPTGQVQQYQIPSIQRFTSPTPLPAISGTAAQSANFLPNIQSFGQSLGRLTGSLISNYQPPSIPVNVQPAYNAGQQLGQSASSLASAFAQSINRVQKQVTFSGGGQSSGGGSGGGSRGFG